jgi:DNA-binding winged helix-turn-helix (wHTH) protein
MEFSKGGSPREKLVFCSLFPKEAEGRMPVRFGDCVFDSGTWQVLRAGKQVQLSPKAFQLLEILIGRRPNAVSKEGRS